MKILVVDDNTMDRRLTGAQLTSAGHQVFCAGDGTEGWRFLRHQKVDRIISDVFMPRMDGYRLCYEVRRDERYRSIPFLVYTGTYTSRTDEKFALRLGADAFLRKPARAEELIRVIQTIKSHPRAASPMVTEAAIGIKGYNEQLVRKLEAKNLELEQQAEELRLAREPLNAFFDGATAGMCVLDSQFRYVQINKALATMHGIPAEQHIGRSLHEIIPNLARTLTGPLRKVFSTRKPALNVEVSGELPPLPGVKRHWLASYFPLSTSRSAAVGVIVVEITDWKQMEERLSQVERQCRAFMEHIPGFAWLKDRQGRFLYLSPPSARAVGIPRRWHGKKSVHVWSDLMNASHVADHEKVVNSKTVLQTVQNYPKKNGTGYVLVTKFPVLDESGAVMFVGGMGIDISEQKKAEEQVRHSREQLRALSARLQVIREQERTRIAREIHDVLGQNLTSLNMDMEWFEAYLRKSSKGRFPDNVRRRLKGIRELLLGGTRSVQRIAADLRPAMLDDLGLAATLEWAAKDWEQRSGIPCRWTHKLEPLAINRDQATALFRIYQEILTNISRHARARHVTCSFKHTPRELTLEVRDDGRGFKPEKIQERKSMGLLGMQERALLLGGSVEIHSALRKGTRVLVRVPLGSIKQQSHAVAKVQFL